MNSLVMLRENFTFDVVGDKMIVSASHPTRGALTTEIVLGGDYREWEDMAMREWVQSEGPTGLFRLLEIADMVERTDLDEVYSDSLR